MSLDNTVRQELTDLIVAYTCGFATDDQFVRLQEILRSNDEAVAFYVESVDTHASLYWYNRESSCDSSALECHELLKEDWDSSLPSDQEAERSSKPADAPYPTTFFVTSFPKAAFGYLTAGWPMAYLIATVILAIGVTIASAIHVSRTTQFACDREASPNLDARWSNATPLRGWKVIGRITGMFDCSWNDEAGTSRIASAVPRLHSPVALGDRFALRAGLLEITYDTGAKVLLQGPMTYQVDTADGGYLAVGKLTAKLEKKNEPKPSSPSLFTITTPTAIVTDLGTEFGVEVTSDGQTFSQVFRGVVRVRTIGGTAAPDGYERVLHAQESVSVTRDDKNQVVLVSPTASAPKTQFVRAIPQKPTKTFDLVDVVAGGDGFSGKRENGIPNIGTLPTDPNDQWRLVGDYRYHRLTDRPFINGVFIPDGSRKPVQTDSAGHAFTDFPTTVNATVATQVIWAGRGIRPDNSYKDNATWPLTVKLAGIDYGQRNHGLLMVISNQGITFDLDAIRLANAGWNIATFRSIIANVDWVTPGNHFVDFRVIVDGESKAHFRQISALNGAIPVSVPIRSEDRFLTLTVTDGGDDLWGDFAIFGDPRLELQKNTQPTAP
jgi:hypothetical protein